MSDSMAKPASHGPTEINRAAAPTPGATTNPEPRFHLKDYALVLKPRVMSLVVFTGLIGMLVAPGTIDPLSALIAVSMIALGAGASGAINMWFDADIDLVMKRTQRRPIPAGRMTPVSVLVYGVTLAILSVAIMALGVNLVAAELLALTILYYVFIYTIWLKRRTPQNIVIGGASGALPPVIGWAAVTGDVGLGAIALFAIIFLWTPPHTWALALFRREDYEKANVPMLPVVAGETETRRQIAIYTALLVPTTLAPVALGLATAGYGLVAAGLGIWLVIKVRELWTLGIKDAARPLFFTSIAYLFGIFLSLGLDRLIVGFLG